MHCKAYCSPFPPSAIFSTCYMATANSSEDTKKRAKQLADEIGRFTYFVIS